MEDIILMAKFLSTHGVKGNIKLEVYTDNFEHYASKNLFCDKIGNKFVIKKVGNIRPGVEIVSVQGISNRNDVLKLVGTDLYINRSDFLDNLTDSEVYVVDLIGCSIINDETKEILGVVTDVVNYGAGDILCIELLNTKKEVMYPFNSIFCKEVDTKSKTIIINSELQ